MNERIPFFKRSKAIIGMVHLRPLPGAPLYKGDYKEAIQWAIRDARVLEEGGADGLLIENIGDMPFPEKIGVESIAAITYISTKILEEVSIPIGFCTLKNYPEASLAMAKAVGGKFVRVGFYSEVRVVDTGIIGGNAPSVIRYRKSIDAQEVKIFADVDVKHSIPLISRPIEELAKEAVFSGLADGVVITGKETGMEASLEDLERVRKVVDVPVLIGSGATTENIHLYLPLLDGVIIGTNVKENGDFRKMVDLKRVKEFVKRVEELL